MHFQIFPLTVFCLLYSQCNAEFASFNYTFDYLTSVEVKLAENEYSHVLNYTGNVEMSTFKPLSLEKDHQEFLLVKLNIDRLDELTIGKSIIGIITREKGVLEKIIVDSNAENGMLNLLKGVINLIIIDDLRQNKTEDDVNGECKVVYETVSEKLVIKEKTGCESLTFYSPINDTFDSFSMHQESEIRNHYQFNSNGILMSVNSFETHLLESVISEELSQTLRSNTSLYNKAIESKSINTFNTVKDVINYVFGSRHKDVFLVTVPEINRNEMVEEKEFVDEYKKIIKSYKISKRAFISMTIMKLLRRILNRSFIRHVKNYTPLEMIEILHDALIGCGSKICSEMVISELNLCFSNDATEAKRMLLLIQHINRPSEYLVEMLWTLMPNMSGDIYDQALQSVSSLVEKMGDVNHMKNLKEIILNYIQERLVSCTDDHCFEVHLSAVRNTKMSQLRHALFQLLNNGSNHSNNVMANVFNSLCSLDYQEDTKADVRKLLFELIKSRINFYKDSRVKYEAIFCLIRLENDIKDVVYILNSLKDKNDHLYVFLTRKLKELIKMGIIEDDTTIFESVFFRSNQHHDLNYKGESNMLVNQLMSTKSLYSDIHFNVIGEDGGIIRNSMTDIFLVTTARENHIFSLVTHLSGLQSMVGSSDENNEENVEGILQLIFFGREARPVTLFQGTSQLMSSLWYAPTELQSLLRGVFFPAELYREISFQNGIVVSIDYSGSTYLDFSFKLNSNLWYKTADSLLRVSGQVFIQMTTRINSLSKIFEHSQSLDIKSGLDFDTNIDFSVSPMKNCMHVSRPLSQIKIKTTINKMKRINHSSIFSVIQGSCYSMSMLHDQLCSSL